MASHSVCKIDGCGKHTVGRGWCDAHYRRWRRHGDPEAGRVSPGEPMRWLREHAVYDRFDCLAWPYGISEEGYAKVALDARWVNAARVMCEIAHGAPPTSRHQAAHLCGKGHQACVNPQHLYWATPVENVADQLMHGTRPRGEGRGNAKLTEAKVRQIRSLALSMPQNDIAVRFGISKQQVSKIVRRERWGWLK